MKIVVVSDSHGNKYPLEKIMLGVSADFYIHLGDGERELDSICLEHPEKKVYHVCGNCDYNSFCPEELLICPDKRNVILAVHGHNHAVKYTLEPLKELARVKGANIILYGHTHKRHNEYDNGLYILNPGSISIPRDGTRPSFGVIELLSKGIITNIVDILDRVFTDPYYNIFGKNIKVPRKGKNT